MKKFILWAILLSIFSSAMSPITLKAQSSIPEIKIGKTVNGNSNTFEEGVYVYSFTIKNDMKISLNASVAGDELIEDNPLSFLIWQYYYDSNDELQYNIYSDEEFYVCPSEEKTQTVNLKAGTYLLSVNSEDYASYDFVDYTIKLTDISSYAKKISIPTKATIRIGDTKTLTVTTTPSKSIAKSITWKSSNTKVAKVSSDGIVSAYLNGTCTITGTLKDGNTVTCKITVPEPNLEENIWLQKFYISIHDFYVDDNDVSKLDLDFYNDFSKDVTYVEFTVFQYDNKGDRVPKSDYDSSNFILNNTVKKNSDTYKIYSISDYTMKVKVCVKKIWFSDGKTWTNPHYAKWEKKYKTKYS